MSDGITGELREKMQRYDNFDGTSRVEMGESFFVHLCDAIDAVHALLEQENERLCRELMDRPISVGADALETVARIERENANLNATNTALEEANDAMRKRLLELTEPDLDGWIELPKDADGETICANDDVEWMNGTKHGRVTGIGVGERDGWVWVLMEGKNVSIAMAASDLHHRKSDTWERIIEDALSAKWSSRGERSADFDILVARCKELCERTKGGDAE